MFRRRQRKGVCVVQCSQDQKDRVWQLLSTDTSQESYRLCNCAVKSGGRKGYTGHSGIFLFLIKIFSCIFFITFFPLSQIFPGPPYLPNFIFSFSLSKISEYSQYSQSHCTGEKLNSPFAAGINFK